MIQTELSADTRAIADMLASCPVGELITLAAMSAAIGRDVTTCRHIVQSARKVAQREGGAVFSVERAVGLRRMSAERVTETVGATARGHIRRTAGRARRTLLAATAGSNDLSPEAQRRLAAEVSVLGLMEHLSRDSVTKPAPDAPIKPTPVAVTARTLLTVITGKKDDAA